LKRTAAKPETATVFHDLKTLDIYLGFFYGILFRAIASSDSGEQEGGVILYSNHPNYYNCIRGVENLLPILSEKIFQQWIIHGDVKWTHSL
jgi:hypothetical protein